MGLIWIVVGILLVISELLATSVIAVFIGFGAIVTGILIQLNVLETAASQYLVFGGVSLFSLLIARKKLKELFVGRLADPKKNSQQFQKQLGERVTVSQSFQQGRGRVLLNGVQWSARSQDPLVVDEVAWVVNHDGITLDVQKEKPTSL